MNPYRKMRGLPDRKLMPLLAGHQALHGRTFTWTLAALLLSIVNAIVLGLVVLGKLP